MMGVAILGAILIIIGSVLIASGIELAWLIVVVGIILIVISGKDLIGDMVSNR